VLGPYDAARQGGDSCCVPLSLHSSLIPDNPDMDRSDPRRILIVEDDALIAVSLQDDFEEAGFAVAGPFTTCAAALAWLSGETPDAAVLDSELSDGACREIARELSARGVRFLFYSGHDGEGDLAAEFPSAPWIEKPALSAALIGTCRDLLRAA
jgi:DNA-binding response OmpR family regulator